MKFFKLSLGQGFIDNDNFTHLKQNNLVSIGINTLGKGQSSTTQFEEFLNAKRGDLFYICRSNNSIEMIGMFKDQRCLHSIVPNHEDWVDREYIPIAYAINRTAYDKNLDKWWSPKNNSTFIELKEDDFKIFEKDFLFPVFGKKMTEIKAFRDVELSKNALSIDYYMKLQLLYNELYSNETALYLMINNIKTLDLKKLQYEYGKKSKIDSQPVVLLRSKVIEVLQNGDKINSVKIAQLKNQLGSLYEKNVYRSWSSDFRILYPLIFVEDKNELETFFYSFIKDIQVSLGIQEMTKIKLVHFDGPQNQGFSRIWFAIYNKNYPSQKLAKQLFFEINNGIKYGLLDQQNAANNILHTYIRFDYKDLISTLNTYKDFILNDNAMTDTKIAEYIEILEYKKQIILQGPPGTGKTKLAKEMAEKMITSNDVEDKKPTTITKDDILVLINSGTELTSVNGQTKYIVSAVNDKTIDLTSDRSDKLSPTFKEVLKSYNTKLWRNHKDRNSGFLPYSDAIAKYMYENIKEIDRASSYYKLIQFHPSYSYEDFVRGIVAKPNNTADGLTYEAEDKILAKFAQKSFQNPQNNYVLIIDEINRANLSSVLGELIYALEYRGAAVESIYEIQGKNKLILPTNLYIIGTMNTADRSVGHIDYAIRRRFAFIEVTPENLTDEINQDFKSDLFREVSALFNHNTHLSKEFKAADVQLGHSYFIQQYEKDVNGYNIQDKQYDFKLRLEYEIKPILLEYLKDGILIEKKEGDLVNIIDSLDKYIN